jgi:hypothetical protein
VIEARIADVLGGDEKLAPEPVNLGRRGGSRSGRGDHLGHADNGQDQGR